MAALAASGQGRKTVFMVTDAEGVAGICRQEQTDPKDTEMRQLLTGEINAAVEGFLEGGVDEVIVWDGHDGSATLSTQTIHPKAKLMMGGGGLTMTLERGYSGVAFLGQHAKAGVRAGIMAHSYSSLGIQNMPAERQAGGRDRDPDDAGRVVQDAGDPADGRPGGRGRDESDGAGGRGRGGERGAWRGIRASRSRRSRHGR